METLDDLFLIIRNNYWYNSLQEFLKAHKIGYAGYEYQYIEFMKKRLFFDMDNVLVDFQSGLDKVDEETKNRYRAKGPGDNSKLEKKVMAANRQNFIRNIREVNNRNNGMTDEEYRDMMHDRL